MIIFWYHEVFFRLAVPAAMPAHLVAYSLEKTSWYHNITILLGVEDHPYYIKHMATFEAFHWHILSSTNPEVERSDAYVGF